MKKTPLSKHPLVTGTILLTSAGLLSRLIGFFYRIFLSHTIGAEGLGIYQLIFPIYAMTFSLTVAGIQSSISKFVAEAAAKGAAGTMDTGRTSFHKSRIPHTERSDTRLLPDSFTYLYVGLFLSLLLSFLCMIVLYRYADVLAVRVLEEPRCTPLLQILSLTIPFGAIHSCINGYYYGLQKTAVPAGSQLLEQLARVGGVYVLYRIATSQGQPVTIHMAVWGLVIGEIASVLYSVSFTRFRKGCHGYTKALAQISVMALPLTANRVFINLFQSVEAIMIPGKLKDFGYLPQEALSVYGVLTGMAMPMVLFPSAITNSVSVMLLPAISEAQAKNDREYVRKAIRKSCFYCITLGLSCTLGFLLVGRPLGQLVFANQLAGTFIVTFAWICPFLYLTTTLSSIINGLGKTGATFLLNLAGSGIRILAVVVFIPIFGIRAYMIGMLVSHLAVSGAALLVLKRMDWQV